MDVDFNSLRKQTCWAYDKLARRMNNAIEDEYGTKKVVINVDDIQNVMDDLRGLIMASAWVYDKDNKDFQCVGDEVGDVVWFNSEEEND
jgi:hypothetical protein